MIRFCCSFLLALGFWFTSSTVWAAEKPWIEVDSPHFKVISNGSEQGARRIALEFEQMRATLELRFPSARLETGAPLLILAARDEQTAMELAPWLKASKKKGIDVAGYYESHWEKQFAMVRIDLDNPDNHDYVYHEYTHSIVRANFHWLPLWLDEGISEFYGNTRFDNDKIYIGAPSERYMSLQHLALMPLDKLLAMRSLRDGNDAEIFYAESWALIHFLTFSPGMGNGEKLAHFQALLENGTEQTKAFETVFGDIATLEKSFDSYVHRFSFPAAYFKNSVTIDPKSFQVRKLSIAETDAQLGSYHLWSYDSKDAEPLIDAAIKEDPKLGLAREDLGFLDFLQAKDDEALNAFSKAYELDPSLYLSLYYKTMLSHVSQSQPTADVAALRDAMLSTLKINPDFAPAYIQLALLDLRQGIYNEAFAAANKAEKLEPWRAGYHLLSGNILLREGRGEDASKFAQFVAERWVGPDHNEAVDLWNLVPESQRTQGSQLSEDVPKDTQTQEGEVHSVTCSDKEPKVKVVIDHGGQLLTFQQSGGYFIGFTDTLWYGTDHFSGCRHLNGMRAVVRYKPPKDSSYAGEIVGVEYRIDLPKTGMPVSDSQAAK